jgi:hypothetical protein
MTAATSAGALYALIVFLIGFIFGTIRVLLLPPPSARPQRSSWRRP